MQISLTVGSASNGRSARSVNPREDSPTEAVSACLEFIYGAKVKITSDEHLDTVTLVLDDSRGDVEGVLQHLGDDVDRRRGTVDHRSTIARAQARFECHVDDRDENCRPKAVPEVTIDLPWKTR